jgi:hypothetical protein
MTVNRFSQASLSTPTRYRNLMAGSAYLPQLTDFQLISTQLILTNTTQVDFTSIPSTFRHLQVRMTARSSGTGTDVLDIRFNGITTAAYNYHNLYGDGSTVSSNGNSTAQTSMEIFPAAMPAVGAAAGMFGAAVIDVLDYGQTTKNKTIRALSGHEAAGQGKKVSLNSGFWNNTAAVNQVSFLLIGGRSFVAGSRFSLYGWN